jgi:hypothetical protein
MSEFLKGSHCILCYNVYTVSLSMTLDLMVYLNQSCFPEDTWKGLTPLIYAQACNPQRPGYFMSEKQHNKKHRMLEPSILVADYPCVHVVTWLVNEETRGLSGLWAMGKNVSFISKGPCVTYVESLHVFLVTPFTPKSPALRTGLCAHKILNLCPLWSGRFPGVLSQQVLLHRDTPRVKASLQPQAEVWDQLQHRH